MLLICRLFINTDALRDNLRYWLFKGAESPSRVDNFDLVSLTALVFFIVLGVAHRIELVGIVVFDARNLLLGRRADELVLGEDVLLAGDLLAKSYLLSPGVALVSRTTPDSIS